MYVHTSTIRASNLDLLEEKDSIFTKNGSVISGGMTRKPGKYILGPFKSAFLQTLDFSNNF